MPDVRYNRNHHAGGTPEARIANRLKNSGDAKNADVVVQTGNSARRTFHNIHNSANHVAPPNVRKEGA